MARKLEITTRVGCRLMCNYCPQPLLNSVYQGPRDMTMETFARCLDNVPKTHVGIHFSGFSEAWLNPFCTEMFLWARERDYCVRVFTTLFGFTHQDLDRMENYHVPKFAVHLPDAYGDMTCNVTDEYVSIVDRVARRDKPLTKHVAMVCFGEVHPKLSHVKYRDTATKVITRAGNVSPMMSRHRKPRAGPIRCSRNKPGKEPVLVPSGELYLCCCDYGLKHKVGNLLNGKWDDIWKREEFSSFVRSMGEPDSDIICRKCEWARNA